MPAINRPFTRDQILGDVVRQLRHHTSAITQAGTAGADTLAPADPTGIAVSSTSYANTDGARFAEAVISWNEVTTNSDGSPITDLDGYLVSWAKHNGTWSAEALVAAGSSVYYVAGFTLGQAIDARVRARDKAGNLSGFNTVLNVALTNDTTAPNPPSTPTVTGLLAGIRVVWDGLDNAGAAMPVDFDRVEVHQSTASGFTPSTATLVDSIPMRGGASTIPLSDYGTTHYVRLVAVDRSGNASAPSAEASGTPAQAVDADLLTATITNRIMGPGSVAQANIQDAAVGTAQIIDASIVTAKIANLAVTDAKIGSLSVTKLTAGVLGADVTVSARIKTADVGARVELNSTGLKAYNNSGTNTVAINSDGSASFTGTVTSSFISGSTVSGGNVLGAYISTSINDTSTRVVLSGGRALFFYDGIYLDPGEITAGTGDNLDIIGPSNGAPSSPPMLRLRGQFSSLPDVTFYTYRGFTLSPYNGSFCGMQGGNGGSGTELQSRPDGSSTSFYNGFAGAFFRTASSRNYKRDIADVPGAALDRLRALRPRQYRLDNAGPQAPVTYGFVAEELPADLRAGDGYEVNAVLAALVAAVQELDRRMVVTKTPPGP